MLMIELMTKIFIAIANDNKIQKKVSQTVGRN